MNEPTTPRRRKTPPTTTIARFCMSVLVLLIITVWGATIALIRSAQAQPSELAPPAPRPFPISPGFQPWSPPRPSPIPPSTPSVAVSTVTSGTWTPLKDHPSGPISRFKPGGIFLLTDGTVLAQDLRLINVGWWKLTPDNAGSYVTGTWTKVASPPHCYDAYHQEGRVYSPLDYASAVLPDGRFIIVGGEFNYNYNSGHAVWTDQGAIYDPVADSWTCVVAPKGWLLIGDAASVVLSDGTFMIAHPENNQVATLNLDRSSPRFNVPFTPPGKSFDRGNGEEGWTLLPDGEVLTLAIVGSEGDAGTAALGFDPFQQSWSSAGNAPDPLVLFKKGGRIYHEIGPATLRPDGTVFAEGATGYNDIYDTRSATWSRGPVFPTISKVSFSGRGCSISGVTEQLAASDAPAALLPNGNVLVAASPVDSKCGWIPPTEFFEFDGTNLTKVAAPSYAPRVVSYAGRLLVLPTGQVLNTNYGGYGEIYTPTGYPNPNWLPTISDCPRKVTPGGTDYEIDGSQFNGLSQAVAYGDDYQAATNYPLVRFTNNATHHVFYARTHSHSTMAVATGSALVYTEFDVPIRIERGPSSLVVVANGIASKPVEVDVSAVTPLATPTATRTPLPTAAATATSTPSPRAPVASNSNGNGGGSTVWLAFFTLATGWSLFQLLKNLARTRDE
jgi:hypothetical protein